MFFVGPQLVRVLRRSKPAMGLFFGVLEGVRTSEGRFPKEPAMYLVIRVIMVIIISSNYLFCGNAGVKGRSVAIHQRAATCNFLPLVATSNRTGIEQIQKQVDFPFVSVTQLLLM